MKTVIVSDVHIGSPFCRHALFLKFLDALPEHIQLVLNGDILDKPDDGILRRHWFLVDRLGEEHRRRPLVWVNGNHDRKIPLPALAGLRFVRAFELPGRLIALHGHTYPDGWTLSRCLSRFVWLCQELLAERRRTPPLPSPVPFPWRSPWVYRAMRLDVLRRAYAIGQARNFPIVVCGHTHWIEDRQQAGIRYLNPGAWTNTPAHCIIVDDEQVALRDIETAIRSGF